MSESQQNAQVTYADSGVDTAEGETAVRAAHALAHAERVLADEA